MDGPAPPEEDFTSLSIPDRLAHKNWKARVSAYESLIKTFKNTASETDPAFKPYLNNTDLIKKFASDANAVAQEKGVECLVSLVQFVGENAAKTREAIVPVLVDKCLGSTRAGTKNQALELILQYVETENGAAGVVTDILPGLGAKQPKVVAGCVLVLKEVVRNFGIQVAPPPPMLKALPKIFAHSDKTVRAEGTALAHALYQYLGSGIESWLSDLKPVQVKELKEGFEALERDGKGKGSTKPERLTRAQAREAEANAGAGEEAAEEEAPAEPESFDPRAFAEPEDIVPKLPSNMQTNLKSSKWKERKEVLDDLLTLLNACPRVKDASELSELTKSLATCISKDANINCVMVAANCLEALAKAMMGTFARYREGTVPLMLVRLKERKANVTDAIGAALDAIFSTVTLIDILPDLEPALKDKNPQVKEGTLKFLGRALANATTPLPPNQIKPLSESLATLLEDGFEGARTEAAVCFGTLMKMVGERPLNAVMDSMADIRKAKVKEAFEKATVKCKAGGAPPPRKPAAPKAPVAKKSKSVVEAEPETPPPPPPAKKPVAKPPVKKPAAAPKKPPASAPPAKGGKPAPAAGSLDGFKYKHTPEDAEALAADTIPANLLADFADANWKTRLAALEEMTTWLEQELNNVDAEVLVRALAKKGWNEKNFQVSSKLYGILSILAQRSPSFGRSCVALSVGHLTEKLGDMKLKKPASETLLDFAEKTSLQFVLSQAYEPLSKQKAPKVLADATTWMGSALTEFGIAGVALRSLIDFLKIGLANSNATVRTSATKTAVTIKLFAGSSIKDLLEDINPQLLATISSEFDKVEGTDAPTPTRTSADLASAAPAGSSGGKGAAAVADPLDDLFPRVEFDSLMKGTTILADAKSDAWKTKKEALEALQGILDQGNNKRLKPTMGEIGQVLKARVVDTNKAVQTLALDIVARVAAGMGKPFERHTRLYALPIATVLSDQKAPVRNTALQTLTAIATACEGIDSMVSGFATALETQNPMQKATLLGWLADWSKENEPGDSLDIHSWAATIVGSLDDRNTDVRKAAQAILPFIVRQAGFDFVMQQTNALKPASRNTAVPLIQAARPAVTAPVVEVVEKKTPAASTRPSSVASTRHSSQALEPEPAPPTTATAAVKAPSKLGVRRKLQGTSRPESRAESISDTKLGGPSGLKKPGLSSMQVVQSPVQSSFGPFHSSNPDSKKPRLGKDVQKWVNEGGPTRKDLAELLQAQMEPHASKDLVAKLFSHDHSAVNDHVTGLGMMADFYSTAHGDEATEKIGIANLDLPLKYVSIKIHESQSNLVAKCLEVVEAVVGFARNVNYQLTESEAICFIPTISYKLGDAREPVRNRVSLIVRELPKVYAYSRIFQFLLDYGMKAKVAKTRQGSLDEMSAILKKSGMGACEPSKAMPAIAALISDKDPAVRKSALTALSEVYTLVGEKIWAYVGPLSSKDKTQLEERLRRVPGPSSLEKLAPASTAPPTAPAPGIARLAAGSLQRPSSPAFSKLARPASPAKNLRPASPAPSHIPGPESPVRPRAGSAASNGPTSPTGITRPKSLLPSRLGRPRINPPQPPPPPAPVERQESPSPEPAPPPRIATAPSNGSNPRDHEPLITPRNESSDDITITISSILSSDPLRSVDALKKIQKILSISPDAGPSSPQYRDLAEHTEGLMETITLQMAHAFDNPDNLIPEDNFRLAKHLIQTLNNFCDHSFLAESLTVEIITSLLEELTLRLLETDDSPVKKIKDLSRFINMIILRLFATGRRMSIFRALFALLLQIVKPFPTKGSLPDSKEAKVAELVLKCVWKLARNIPQDLAGGVLDPVELFPAVEHFLQSVPPNEWRARATNKVPCGDMPLRTIKVIIQHVVAHYGDDVYELLSASFDDPSATIVYPYVYRILNAGNKVANNAIPTLRNNNGRASLGRAAMPASPASSRPRSPDGSVSTRSHRETLSHRTSPSGSSANGRHPPYSPTEEPDPDAQLITIIGHISSETTGALHKEGITELHQFLKAYPHKRPRVEKLLESTGPAFRKYINRALASRAAEDQERDIAVTQTSETLEHAPRERNMPSPTPRSPTRGSSSGIETGQQQERLSRLHDIFQYRSSTLSTGSSAPRTSEDFGSA